MRGMTANRDAVGFQGMRRVGFADFPDAWDGPFGIEFRLVSEHTKTVRFHAEMQKHGFDLYLPRFMLPKASGPPPETLVAILDSSRLNQPIGFAIDDAEPPLTGERCVYSYSDEKANSYRFDAIVQGQRYSLYVPKEVFGTRERPGRIALEVEFDH